MPLRDGRILWLFGDSFVKQGFVRNTIAIERGTNPATAAVQYVWRGSHSYFPEHGRHWFWPQHGIRLGRGLVVFLDRVQRKPGGPAGFNFEGAGWRLALSSDVRGPPRDWRFRLVAPPHVLDRFDAGKAVVRNGAFVEVLALPERRGPPFPGYLLRWRAVDLARGRLGRPQWWAGRRGWVAAGVGPAVPVVRDAGPECSLSYDAKLRRWVLVHTEGFGATTIVVAFARRIEGPWMRQRVVYRPPESDRPHANVYAAKGHPELSGADLVLTYAVNGRSLHFVRLRFRAG